MKHSPGMHFAQLIRARQGLALIVEIAPFNPTDRRTPVSEGSLTALDEAEQVFTLADQASGCQENRTSLGLQRLKTGPGREHKGRFVQPLVLISLSTCLKTGQELNDYSRDRNKKQRC